MMKNLALFATFAVAASACKKEEPPPPPPPPAAPAPGAAAPGAAPAAAAPAGPPGSIKGTVDFTGTAPTMAPLKRDADPVCAKKKMTDEAVVVKGGKLANVFVRISSPVAGSFELPKEPLVIAQQDCMYRPRVVAGMEGQEIQIKNGDPTLHNVHTYKGAATWFNQAQIQGTPPIVKKLEDGAATITFKCDVHPWMLGHVGVAKHPFVAVSGEDGSFEIKNVPAGKYTLEAWHEKAGTKTLEVEVKGGAAADAKFAYAAGDIK